MSRILIAVLALCLAGSALAERPSYNYVQFAYESVDLDVGGGFDVDGDGYADVIVGARVYDAGQVDEGAAFVFLGSASLLAIRHPSRADP